VVGSLMTIKDLNTP